MKFHINCLPQSFTICAVPRHFLLTDSTAPHLDSDYTLFSEEGDILFRGQVHLEIERVHL